MYAVLARRNYGIHQTVKKIHLPRFVYVRCRREPLVNEEALLADLPKKFLPVKPEQILLMVGSKTGMSSTAVSKPKLFRSWVSIFHDTRYT